MLFTTDELHRHMHEHLKPRNVLALDVTRLDGEAEQSIVICRAPSAVTTDPVRFWVSSVENLNWGRGAEAADYRSRYIEASLCRPIHEPSFNQLVARCLFDPRVNLPLHRGDGPFLGAMQMSDAWDDVSAMAGYEDELIAFFWDTTA